MLFLQPDRENVKTCEFERRQRCRKHRRKDKKLSIIKCQCGKLGTDDKYFALFRERLKVFKFFLFDSPSKCRVRVDRPPRSMKKNLGNHPTGRSKLTALNKAVTGLDEDTSTTRMPLRRTVEQCWGFQQATVT